MPNVEQIREFLLGLPHVVETMQWGDNLVFWVGDKAIGGKMFVLINLSDNSKLSEKAHGVVSYPVGKERFAEMLEIEGIFPAPYMARIHWVAARGWGVFRTAEWQDELRAAHGIVLAKLPPKVTKVLALPLKEQKKVVAEKKKALAKK